MTYTCAYSFLTEASNERARVPVKLITKKQYLMDRRIIPYSVNIINQDSVILAVDDGRGKLFGVFQTAVCT